MYDKLTQALDFISDDKIIQAANWKKRRSRIFFRALAAVLALAILTNLPYFPGRVNAAEIAAASGTRKPERPDRDDYEIWEDFRADLDIYDARLDKQNQDAITAFENLKPFFMESGAAYVDGSTENKVWSPVNAYIALAALTELTAGDSRQQILDVLNVSDMDTLRTQVGAVWEELYYDLKGEGNEVSLLANSLWLNENLSYDQQTMDNIAHYHYASVYQTDLQSPKAAKALQTWLNNNTGGLLTDKTSSAAFPPEAVLTLASTVYLQSKWSDEFNAAKNTIDPFHAPGGDVTATYMNKKEMQTYYFWGEDFGAVYLWLKNGCKMWFILPDEDKTVMDVLNDGQYLDILTPWSVYTDEDPENSKYMKVNLSVPKFDVASSVNLSGILQQLGIRNVFDSWKSDFTAITSDIPVTLAGVNQAARVIIDEQGVKAASYLEFPGAGAAAPPEEIIDFILDRPFVFVIADSNTGIPLFTGVVNEP
jgi:serine protease inhibitor